MIFPSSIETITQSQGITITGLRRADSGEAIPAFQLTLRPGPLAPFVNELGELVDPNEIEVLQAGMRQDERQQRKGPRKPSLAAQVRVAAERLSVFTRDELRAAIFGQESSGIERHWFGVAFGQMLMKGHVHSDGNDGFTLVKGFDPAVDAIRERLRDAVGKPRPLGELEAALGFAPSGPQIRSAVDLLRAEGYEVTRTSGPGKGDYVVQTVSASAGMEDDEDEACLRARMITGSTRRSRPRAVRQ